MIRFSVLGSIGLCDSRDREITSLLIQPKRLALLSCLALSRPTEPQQRDWLLGVLWPELDVEHGRGALRNALYVLRRSLGEGIVCSYGNGLVGLDRSRFWCDAVEFEEALDRGDGSGALDLYRGDLLRSFYVGGAPEFEHWLEEQRTRLRERAVDAAWSQADSADCRGDYPAAVRYAKQALTLARYDERAARRLITALDRAGDRAAAVRVYQEFTERLAADLQLEPSAETSALIAAVRSGSVGGAGLHLPALAEHDRTRGEEISPRRIPAMGLIQPDAVQDAPDPGTRARPIVRVPRPERRFLAGVLGAMLAIGLFVAGSWWSEAPAAEFHTEGDIAVFPFVSRGTHDNSSLGEGMTTLLSTNLSRRQGGRPVDPRVLLSYLAQEGPIGQDPGRVREVAQRFRASRFVLGEVVEAGGQIRITAALYRTGADRPGHPVLVGEAVVEGRRSEIFALLDRLTAQLIGFQSDDAGLE